MRKLLSGVLATAAVVVLAAATANAAWPEKPIKIVVPFKAGGTSDQVARAYAAAIEENHLLPQPMVILDVGGHFSIGSRQVLEAAPDGYTFLVVHIALMGGQAMGQMDFGYKDFAPVATTGQFCLCPMVRKDSGINSVKELLDKAKAEPDKLLFGVNIGAINHMAGIALQNLEPGARFRFVQIGGGTANFTALTGAQTNVAVNSAAEVINFTRLPDGTANPDAQVKPLAYTGAARFPALADVPTMKELGYDMTFCVDNWWFAPKDTPKEAIDGMVAALQKAQSTDRIKRFNASQGFAPAFLSGDAMQKSLDATWNEILPLAKQAAGK
jgi:tripartite-type tricarboxylate transporter receptor subunit TctC